MKLRTVRRHSTRLLDARVVQPCAEFGFPVDLSAVPEIARHHASRIDVLPGTYDRCDRAGLVGYLASTRSKTANRGAHTRVALPA